MEDNTEAINRFMELTNFDEERAKACLEASNNDLLVALDRYFGSGQEEDRIRTVEDDDDDDIQELPVERASSGPTKPQPKPSRFQTVSGLNQESSSDEEEGGQAFYAGGSLHSGQQVLGPSSRNQIVVDMFRSVKEHGGEVIHQEAGSSRTPSTTVRFGGTGYRLGQSSNDTEVVAGAAAPQGQREVTLKLWRQGFSVDDGPLRKYNEPENMQFLKTVARGVIPDELLRMAEGNEVHLKMEDHSAEDYAQAKPKLKAFSGKGNLLGSPVPGATLPVPDAAATPDERSTCEQKAKESLALDESQPVTSVQIRLADGSRLVGRFNHTHTIADIRTYINTARPEYLNSSFRLLTTFPSKELAEEAATIQEAGILNAALLQRIG